MEIHMPKFGPDTHKGSLPHRDALTRIDKVEHGSW
jgi:hypothetical protein